MAVGDRIEARRVDAEGQVITPGFVDAHLHLAAFLGAGKPYQRCTGPGLFYGGGRLAGLADGGPDVLDAGPTGTLSRPWCAPVRAAMLRTGTTGAVDAGSCGIDGLVAAATELGISAAIGPCLADLWHDERGTLVRQSDPHQLLADARDAIRRHDGSGAGRIRVGYAPVGAVEHGGAPLRAGPLMSEHIAVLGGGSLANNSQLHERGARWGVQGTPWRWPFWSRSRSWAWPATDAPFHADR